jgi:Secretion system C-terminal sorting domain
LAINRYPTGEKQINIPLGVSNSGKGDHKLRFNDKGSFGDLKLYLQDTYLKKYMEISEGAEYPFTISTDANSTGVSRFVITNAPAGLLTETGTQTNATGSMALKVYPSPSDGRNVSLDLYNVGTDNVKVTIMDLTGRLVYSTNYGVSGTLNHFSLESLTELANGMYLVDCQTSLGTLKTTFTISK